MTDALVQELRGRELRRRRAELESSTSGDSDGWSAFVEEFSALETLRDTLSEEVQALRETVASQEQELEGHRANYAAGVAHRPAAASLSESSARDLEPSSWEEFADGLGLAFDRNDGFAITERAEKQVVGNPYPDPARMWDHLCRLGEAAAEWRRLDGAPGQRLRNWIQVGYGIEISLQDNNLRGSDAFTYEGVELSNIPHVKVDDFVDPGRCGRIHFGIDTEHLRLVVDHIGLHR